MLPILTTSLIHFPLKVGRMSFLNLGVKGTKYMRTTYFDQELYESVFVGN